MSASKQLCTFTLDGHLFGVEVGDVQEVVRYQELTRVPLAPAEVCGLLNLRGRVVTAVDLRRRIGLPDRPADARPMTVVLRSDDGTAGLVVDAVEDVVGVSEAAFEPPPGTLRGTDRKLVRGAYKLNGRLLLVLDPAAVLAL